MHVTYLNSSYIFFPFPSPSFPPPLGTLPISSHLSSLSFSNFMMLSYKGPVTKGRCLSLLELACKMMLEQEILSFEFLNKGKVPKAHWDSLLY